MIQRTILVSEDDTQLAAVLARLLRKGGYEVITDLHSDVVALAAKHRPSAILLDLIQGTDGRILLGELKRHTKTVDIPVIVLTGVDHPHSRKFCEALGASEYVLKPFNVDLLRRVGEITGAVS